MACLNKIGIVATHYFYAWIGVIETNYKYMNEGVNDPGALQTESFFENHSSLKSQ